MTESVRSQTGHRSDVAEARELRRGDTVRVRSAREIEATLDDAGELDRLPYMPEMLPLCGQTFTVQARADKTCDTINLTSCSRKMESTVHLVEARCDGSAHGGCQAGCLLFFKEEWLERVDAGASAVETEPASDELVERLQAATQVDAETYRCQATQLLEATTQLQGHKHFLRDVTTRNAPPRQLARGFLFTFIDRYQRFSRRLPARLRINGGDPFPDVRGPWGGERGVTPTQDSGIEAGDLVEIKSLPEIIATLDHRQRNRGLWFDREMMRYCGRRVRVVRRVNRLLDEATGRMIVTKSPCLILDGVVCEGDFHSLCPRRDYAFFREIWVRRVRPDGTVEPDQDALTTTTNTTNATNATGSN